MRINRKTLLFILIVVLAIGGTALVLAQNSAQDDNEVEQIDNDDDERPASAADALLSEAEAIAIAEAERNSSASYIELEREGGLVLYSIALTDGSEVEIDANTGEIVEVEAPGSDAD